jgi:hypothetical protein
MFRTRMTLDPANRTLTAAVGALVLACAAAQFAVAPGVARAAVAFAMVIALALVWAMSPRELVVDEGELRIVRRAGTPLRVPLASVVGAERVDAVGAGTVRVFGAGGFFGSYGLFWNKTLGRFRAFVTRRGPAIVVRRREGLLPIVLTPDDAAGTMAAIDPQRVKPRVHA